MRKRRNKSVADMALAPVLTTTIESLDQEGRGVAHVEGKTIFIEGEIYHKTTLGQKSCFTPC